MSKPCVCSLSLFIRFRNNSDHSRRIYSLTVIALWNFMCICLDFTLPLCPIRCGRGSIIFNKYFDGKNISIRHVANQLHRYTRFDLLYCVSSASPALNTSCQLVVVIVKNIVLPRRLSPAARGDRSTSEVDTGMKWIDVRNLSEDIFNGQAQRPLKDSRTSRHK